MANKVSLQHPLSFGSNVFRFQQVMIVMTHMTNYGNDQLALYTISRLVNFVHRWTNLELKYASPTELADIYFNLFPKDKVPVWLVSQMN